MNELQEQAVQVSWRTAEISLKTFKTLIEALLQNRKSIIHGEQTLSKLNLQNKQLDSVKIHDKDIKNFRKKLNSHSVDFSIKRDRGAKEYTVFFKGQDVDRVYQGLEKCLKGLDNELVRKKPLRDVMEQAIKIAEQRSAEKKDPKKERKKDRERAK